MKKIIFMFLLAGLFSCALQNEIVSISEISIYKCDDRGKGYTTTSAYSEYVRLEELDESQSVTIDSVDCAIVQKIINNSEVSRFRPGKTGLNILFLSLYFNNDRSFHKVILCQNNSFIDYTSKRQYQITSEEDKRLMDSIRKKYNFPMIKW